MKRDRITRAKVVEWLTAEPGLKARELATKAGLLPAYMVEKLRVLEAGGFVRRQELPDTATGRSIACWFVVVGHPPLERARRPGLPAASVPPSMKMLRPLGVAQPFQRVASATDHDSGIVGQALAQRPALDAAWMGRGAA